MAHAKLHHPKVSKCANPQCQAEFRRLGEGKLFLQPSHAPHQGTRRKQQLAAWLCESCSRKFTMRFDVKEEAFILEQAKAA